MAQTEPNKTEHVPPVGASVPPGVPDVTEGTEAAAAAPDARRPLFTAVRWGAVLAGVAVGLAIQLMLTLLGIATGLSSTRMSANALHGSAPLVWAGFSMLVSAFVSGYVAARMSGLRRKLDGVLHGAVTWAVTTLLFAALATSIGGVMVGSVFSSMNQVAEAQAQAAQGEGPLFALLRDQFGQVDVITLRQMEYHLQRGERRAAADLLMERMGIDRMSATAIVDQALILTGSPDAASPATGKPSTSQLQGAGMVPWVVFGAVALGLVLGIGGGRLGVAGAQRANWSART